MNSTAMNNMSTTDNENNAENYPCMLWIAPTSLALLIITGNSMVIGACFHFAKSRSYTLNFILAKSRSYTLNFILALSVADIATGMGMVFNVFTRINADILSYKIPCILSYEVFFTMALISVNLLACTTFDRYLSICKHERHKQWNTKTAVTVQVYCSYIIGFIVGGFPFLGLNRWENGMKCEFKELYPQELYLVKASLMFLGFGVSFVLYVFILRKAWRIYSGRHIEVLHNAIVRQRNNFIQAKLMGIVTILNTICWLPYSSITLVFGITNQSNSAGYLDFALLLLGFTNSLINPIIYAWNRPDFRALWKKQFRCRPQVENSDEVRPTIIFVQSYC